jgi:hypothetical protein
MVHWHPRLISRAPKRGRPVTVAYCCTPWDGPGASLAGLRESCLVFAAEHGLRIEAWATEVTPDVIVSRYTSLLRYTIEFANDPETDALLIAESGAMTVSAGSAEVIARTLSPVGANIIRLDALGAGRAGDGELVRN